MRSTESVGHLRKEWQRAVATVKISATSEDSQSFRCPAPKAPPEPRRGGQNLDVGKANAMSGTHGKFRHAERVPCAPKERPALAATTLVVLRTTRHAHASASTLYVHIYNNHESHEFTRIVSTSTSYMHICTPLKKQIIQQPQLSDDCV